MKHQFMSIQGIYYILHFDELKQKYTQNSLHGSKKICDHFFTRSKNIYYATIVESSVPLGQYMNMYVVAK